MAAAALFVLSVPLLFGGDDAEEILGADAPVVINNTMSVSEIKTNIESALGVAGNDTVTVTGSKTVSDGSRLSLSIPANKTVIWKATFAGGGGTNALISLTGNGTFEVAADADLSGRYWDTLTADGGNVLIVVSGGTVGTAGGSSASHAVRGGPSGIRMTGGTVRADGTESIAVYSHNGGSIDISGGSIEATGQRCMAVSTGTDVKVTMTGGNVTATGNEAVAISFGGSQLAISGGLVKVTVAGSFAVRTSSLVVYLKGTVSGGIRNDTGGFVAEVDAFRIPASRNGTSDGVTVKYGSTYTSGQIAWDTSGEKPLLLFGAGTPSSATVTWGAVGGSESRTFGGGNTLLYGGVALVAVFVGIAGYFLIIRK